MTLRIENYRGNRQELALLKDEVSIVERKTSLFHKTIQKYRAAITTESFQFELIDIEGMEQVMRRVDESVIELERALQPQQNRFMQFLRVNRNSNAISEQVKIIKGLSAQLSEMKEQLKFFAEENDLFTPDFTVPKARVPVYLDFSTTETLEGELKAMVLENVERSSCNTGNVHGVTGIGGVGKTTTLIALANDRDVWEKVYGWHLFPVCREGCDSSKSCGKPERNLEMFWR